MEAQALVVEALKRPETYPPQERPRAVRHLQTHISHVFVGDRFVYKVKKPVNFGFLDFSTLEKRRHYTEQELILNRRFCGRIYLAVVPITQEGDRIRLGGAGEVVEYALKMRRLPEAGMFPRLLAEGKADEALMERIAQAVADFHRRAETGPHIARFGTIEVIKGNTDENFEQTRPYVGVTIEPEDYAFIQEATNRFYETHRTLFQRRVEEGRIRDGHGDLRAEHICVLEDGTICIFDCIEFNERFRYGDVAVDMAFLAMDLDYLGRPELSRAYVEAYVRFSGDRELPKLLDFYRCYRAYVRGKVDSFLLDDPHLSEEAKAEAAARARRYFKLARTYAERMEDG